MGGSDSKVDFTDILTGDQLGVLNKLVRNVGGYIFDVDQGGMKGVEGYPGQLVPGATDLQRQGFERASSLGNSRDTAGRDEALRRALSGKPAYEVDPAARDKVYEAEKSTMLRDLYRDVLPQLEARAGARGLNRSGFLEHGYERALENVGTNLGSRYAQLGYADEMARRDAAERGAARQMGAIPMFSQAASADVGTLLGAGSAERGIQGQQAGEQFYNWQAAQPYNNPWLGLLPQALGTQGSIPTVTPGTPSAGPAIGGGVGTVLGALIGGIPTFGIGAGAGAAIGGGLGTGIGYAF